MDILSHKEAAAQGLKFYFTGVKCKRGHISQRRVANCQCVDCQREDNSNPKYRESGKRRYQENREAIIRRQTEYSKLHKEQISQYQQEYRELNTKQRLQYHKDKYQLDREERLEYRRRQYEGNPEKYKGLSRKYYELNKEEHLKRSRDYYATNRERLLEGKKQYYKEHYGEVLVRNGARKRRQKDATPHWADKSAIVEVYQQCYDKRQETGENWVVDHHIPLKGKKVCGLHIAENLRIIPWEDNAKKGNKFHVI